MKTQWTICFAFLVVIGNGLDILSTYHVSPDLQLEANPVVISMGRTWESIFLIKGAGVLAAILFFYFSLRGLERRSNSLKGQESILDIYSFLIYRERVSMTKLLLGGWPNDWGAVVAVASLFAAMGYMVSGFLGTAGNTFRFIRSVVDLIMLYSIGAAIGVTISGYLLHIFILKSMKAEHEDSNRPR